MKSIQTQEYFAEDKGLNHYFLMNKNLYVENSLESNRKIIGNDVMSFSLDIDGSGVHNIVFIDDDQKLFYLTKDKEEWNETIITKIQSFYEVKAIKLHSNLNNVNTKNVFMLVKDTRNKDLYCIFSYTIQNTDWTLNKAIDFYYDNNNPIFKSDIDYTGNLHILFKIKENDKYSLNYQIYNIKFNKWELSEKITESTRDLFNTLILCDTNNNINIAWSALEDKNIKIDYIKRKIDLTKKVKWKTSKTLPDNIANLTNPILIQKGSNIRFGWKQDNFYNFVETNLDKDDWKKVSSLKIDSNKPLIPISIIGNKYKDIDTLKAPNTYLYLSNDTKQILGIDRIDSIIEKVKETIQTPTTKKISINTQNKSVSQLSTYLDDISRDLEKSSILNDICSIVNTPQESNDLNSFIEKLNNLYNEMESVKNKELTLLNSILEIRKSNNKLYRKIEEIINDFHESSLSTKEK